MADAVVVISKALRALWAGRKGIPSTADTGGPDAFANGKKLRWRNAANTANVDAIYVDGNDAVVIGTPVSFTGNMAVINDTDGDAALTVTANAGTAVNKFTLANAATGVAPSLLSSGSDTNIDAAFGGKGTGAVKLGQATSVGVDLVADQPVRDSSGNEQLKFVKTASAVNEVTVTNAATGTGPTLGATGGDTDIPLNLLGKGVGIVALGDSGTASCTGTGSTSTATLSKQRGLLTTAALTTVAGAAHTITLTNTKVTATSSLYVAVRRLSATTGIPYITKVTPGAGSVDIEITNIDPAAAINGTLRLPLVILIP